MSTDNRARPRIHRTDDEHDAKIRAYARARKIEPWRALELMIDGAELTPRDVRQRDADVVAARKVAEDLRDELAQAREATRRADEQIARLTRELGLQQAQVSRLDGANRQLTRKLVATRDTPCACAALPDDFETKLAERLGASGLTLDALRARVITLGFSRYDALATDAAKRAAERAARS